MVSLSKFPKSRKSSKLLEVGVGVGGEVQVAVENVIGAWSRFDDGVGVALVVVVVVVGVVWVVLRCCWCRC